MNLLILLLYLIEEDRNILFSVIDIKVINHYKRYSLHVRYLSQIKK